MPASGAGLRNQYGMLYKVFLWVSNDVIFMQASGDPNDMMSVPLNSLPILENVTAAQVRVNC